MSCVGTCRGTEGRVMVASPCSHLSAGASPKLDEKPGEVLKVLDMFQPALSKWPAPKQALTLGMGLDIVQALWCCFCENLSNLLVHVGVP